jgi:4-hydroxythreonine-4-phosphate dehydrogenase
MRRTSTSAASGPPAAPALAVTSGEPAGVGPDLCLALAERDFPARLLFLGDRVLMRERAEELRSSVRIVEVAEPAAHRAGELQLLHVATAAPVEAGRLDPANSRYVLSLLDIACDGCSAGRYAGMVTAPVQKSVICEAGLPFTGHTEYLAARTDAPHPVMLLVAGRLRVALATTHLALAEVPAAITRERLVDTLVVLDAGLQRHFGFARPRIVACGLNPHAGEGGHLGREEIDVIEPALRAAQSRGVVVRGPVPADTAFTPRALADADAVLAMYHDQGLPVLKHAGFGGGVNVTLGLPILRTSVDHGTALDLAATGRADAGSLAAALELAIECANR